MLSNTHLLKIQARATSSMDALVHGRCHELHMDALPPKWHYGLGTSSFEHGCFWLKCSFQYGYFHTCTSSIMVCHACMLRGMCWHRDTTMVSGWALFNADEKLSCFRHGHIKRGWPRKSTFSTWILSYMDVVMVSALCTPWALFKRNALLTQSVHSWKAYVTHFNCSKNLKWNSDL